MMRNKAKVLPGSQIMAGARTQRHRDSSMAADSSRLLTLGEQIRRGFLKVSMN